MLVSRVADHCFWFGRYLERAESAARTLGSTRETMLGADHTRVLEVRLADDAPIHGVPG